MGNQELPGSILAAEEVNRAWSRIVEHIEETTLILIEGLALKCEHRQQTGSFKLRGALNKVLTLDEGAMKRGVICASAGNHGLGVAYAAALRDMRCTVVVPGDAPEVKRDSIADYGAKVIEVDGGYGEAESAGMELAESSGAVWISPYNDREVIAGQATLGLELANQMDELGMPDDTSVWIPVSGGGLVCGVGFALKHRRPDTHVIGVQTEAAPYMYAHFHDESFERSAEEPTLADGLAGPVEEGSITLTWIRSAADDIRTVSEDQIEQAMCWLLKRGVVVEPSAAVPLAAACRSPRAGANVVVLSGGNVDRSVLTGINEKCPE